MNTNIVIFIKLINARWRVWIGSEADPSPEPAKCDAKFFRYEDAEIYARDWETHAFVKGVKVLQS